MATQPVPLTEHGQEFVDSIMRRGQHDSPAAVVDLALRQLEQRVQAQDAKSQAFRKAVSTGITDLDEGRFTAVASEDLPAFVAGLSPRLSQTVASD